MLHRSAEHAEKEIQTPRIPCLRGELSESRAEIQARSLLPNLLAAGIEHRFRLLEHL